MNFLALDVQAWPRSLQSQLQLRGTHPWAYINSERIIYVCVGDLGHGGSA